MDTIKIINKGGFFELNGDKYPKGHYIVQSKGDTINIYNVNGYLSLSAKFIQFVDKSDIPFNTVEDLLSEFDSFYTIGGGEMGGVKINTDVAAGDAFGRVRTSLPNSLFDGQMTYDLQPLLFGQDTNGTGATIEHDATNRVALLSFLNTPTGGVSQMQSFEHFRYRAGHSQLVYITFNMKEGVANVVKYAGYSDGVNGIEFQLNGTTPRFGILSSTDEGNEFVDQLDWNIDKLDGTGPTGISLDITKVQILVLDFQALYVGRVRIGFDLDGVVIWAHEFNHANSDISPYFATANLPIRVGMTCSGTVTTSMNLICCTVQSESGGEVNEGFNFSQEASATVANGVLTHVISIQPKLTFNSITNRTKLIIESVDISVIGNTPIAYYLCLGDVLTGTTAFIDVNTTYSAVQYNALGTTSGTPDIITITGYVAASNQARGSVSKDISSKFPITLDIDGSVRPLGRVTLLAKGIGASSEIEASINWVEIR